MIKNLPQPIPINEDGTANVIGWVNKRSFVVEVNPSVETTGKENEKPKDLDSDESEETEFSSLWKWGKDNNLTMAEFEELQNRLETYIEYEV